MRSLGYRMVARNFRTPQSHGEIDMIGWDEGVLCFVEVKTHSQAGMAPPEMAVDAAKRRTSGRWPAAMCDNLRCERPPPCRFDIVSVVLGENGSGRPSIKSAQKRFHVERRLADKWTERTAEDAAIMSRETESRNK